LCGRCWCDAGHECTYNEVGLLRQFYSGETQPRLRRSGYRFEDSNYDPLMKRSFPPCVLRVLKCVLLALVATTSQAQNSMVGDGFGGRLWYRPTNYTVGSYSAFSLCYSDPCDSSSNQLYGWGNDSNGELGNGPGAVCSNTPVAIPGMSNVRYYSTGYWMGAIKNDDTGWVWSDPSFPFPMQVITNAKFVDASARLVSFVKNDGTVWSIGNNVFGQFGDGTTTSNYSAPVQMTGVINAVRVAVGGYATFVLLADSSVLAVGYNTYGALGDPSILIPNTTLPVPVPALSGIVDIKATTVATAALDANGDVYSWGTAGFAGDGESLNDTLPERVEGLNNIVAISGCNDGWHFLALDANKNCYVYGLYNFFTDHYDVFLNNTDVIDIMAGERFSYIVKTDGTLWAAGFSNGCSIWLNLPDTVRTEFTLVDPSSVPGSCPLVGTVAMPNTNCDGSGTITVSHFGGQAPYQYDIGNGPQNSNIFTGLPLGNYTVTVTDANGCVTTVPCTVEPFGLPAILEDMGTVNACSDEGFSLPSGTTVFIAGIYSDTTFSILGCDTVRSFNVVIEPLPSASLQDTICAGEPFVLPSGVLVNAPGVYTDTLVLAGVCDTVYTFTLALSPLPPVVASISATDTIVDPGESVVLVGAEGLSYEWSPGATLSCTACSTPTASPTETTEYCVVVSNNNSCANDTACVVITVLSFAPPICASKNIFVPSAFSPNGTDKNDQQCVYGGECIANMVFHIYDRWGNKVFESTDPQACWDGTYNGQALDPAVFVYHLSATLKNGDVLERQGNITLVR